MADAAALKTGPTASLLQFEYDTLMMRLQESPCDGRRWNKVVAIAESIGDSNLILQTYRALFKQYPDSATTQGAFVGCLIKNPAFFREAEELFEQLLPKSPFVLLWDHYLEYVRRVNVDPSTRWVVLRVAYERALKHIGHDRDSGHIWAGYIKILGDVGIEGQDTLRRAYHHAVKIPLDNVRDLWSDLRVFEMQLCKNTADDVMATLSPAYNRACAVLEKLSAWYQGLDVSSVDNKLALSTLPTFSLQDRALIGRWKRYIKWEEENPLGLEGNNHQTFLVRVQQAYSKAVVCMRYCPEIWFMAYTWTRSMRTSGSALDILTAGLNINPDSFVLTYAYAAHLEKEESSSDFAEVHAIYGRFIEALQGSIARLSCLTAESAASSGTGSGITPSSVKTGDTELSERKKLYSNVWINYIRFAHRAQGRQSFRSVFGKARQAEFVGWEVYDAAAMMEYHCYPDDGREVAIRIFERGMNKFKGDVAYILKYLGFLISINDENNAHSLFETVIGTFEAQEALPIWERWYRFRSQYDAMETVLKLEDRMAKIYPDGNADGHIKRFGQRHAYDFIDAIAYHDLGLNKMLKLAPIIALPHSNNSTANSTIQSRPNPGKRSLSPPYQVHGSEYRRVRPPGKEQVKRQGLTSQSTRPHTRERGAYQPTYRILSDKHEEKPAVLPPVLDWFIRELPPRSTFDGPVFDADSLMDKLRSAIIASSKAYSRTPSPRPCAWPKPVVSTSIFRLLQGKYIFLVRTQGLMGRRITGPVYPTNDMNCTGDTLHQCRHDSFLENVHTMLCCKLNPFEL
ncbi:Suf-domain-containing protein [Mycena crocata]|nr:Suf-domain-containing protein [Mycena crocata]